MVWWRHPRVGLCLVYASGLYSLGCMHRTSENGYFQKLWYLRRVDKGTLMSMSTSISQVCLAKPAYGQACNGCGYCCVAQPCSLAVELLKCTVGPCVALESDGVRTYCGLVRRPLAYLWQASAPDRLLPPEDVAPPSQAEAELSSRLAASLGLGLGCDAEDPDGGLK